MFNSLEDKEKILLQSSLLVYEVRPEKPDSDKPECEESPEEEEIETLLYKDSPGVLIRGYHGSDLTFRFAGEILPPPPSSFFSLY